MKGKVVQGKYGLQIKSGDTYYHVSKTSKAYFEKCVDKEVEFEVTTTEYNGTEYKWANVPSKKNSENKSSSSESKKAEEEKNTNASSADGHDLRYLRKLYEELKGIFEK